MSKEEILSLLKTEFTKQFGGDPAEIKYYFAPGRVNLIGEHTDYNGGHVFPCALTIGTYAAVRKRDDDLVRLGSLNMKSAPCVEFHLDDPELLAGRAAGDVSGAGWANYPKGVIRAFYDFRVEHADASGDVPMLPSGLDVLFYGDIPAGSGLSSSASLEVLTGLVLRETFGFTDVTQQDLAILGQRAENEYVGMNCGIMDQFASAMGREGAAIFLDTNTLKYEYAPLKTDGAKIVITNSKVKHSLASSAYNTRRSECGEALKLLQDELRRRDGEDGLPSADSVRALGDLDPAYFDRIKDAIGDDVLLRRAKHAVYENERTKEAVTALAGGDIDTFGALMNASHVSLRDDYEVSCPEVDVLVELAWQIPGVIGSRITGGGFGGCTVSIVKEDAIEEFKEKICAAYLERCGKEAEFYVVDPGEGAHTL